jgi:hypothetical protein
MTITVVSESDFCLMTNEQFVLAISIKLHSEVMTSTESLAI